MKKLYLTFAALVMSILAGINVCSINVSAQSDLGSVVDYTGILSSNELENARDYMDEVSQRCGMDVCAVIVDRYNEYDIESAADDFYDYNGYGVGSDNSGIMFYVSMGDREWHITTTGKAIHIFSDNDLYEIGDSVSSYFQCGDYYDGLICFADDCEYHIEYESTFHWEKYLFTSLVCGIVCAVIYLLYLAGKNKNVRPRNAASFYVKDGSMNITRERDIFLYQRHIVTRRETSNGTSVHHGSSGTSHGGASGHF